MLIEIKDVHDEVFNLNPEHIIITYRKKNTNNFIIRTLVEDREVDRGTMIYLQHAPLLSLSVIKFDEKEYDRCKNLLSSAFPELKPTISVSVPEGRYYIGDTVQLTATFKETDETTATWVSKDETVATVNSSGLVTFKKAGGALIEASNPNIPEPAMVMVNADPTIIGLESDREIKLDDTPFNVLINMVPNRVNDIVWTSSNNSVVTVVNGLVAPIGSGNATIKAEYRGTVSTINVIVLEPVFNINIPETLTIQIPEQRELVFSVENMNNTDVTWEVVNGNVISIENNVIKTKSSGSSAIKAKIGTRVMFTSTITVPEIVINTPATLSIEEAQTGNWKPTVTGTSTKPTLTSSNTAVAIINSSGAIQALTPGETTLTATVHGKTKTCVLTVTAIPTPPPVEEPTE
ncbi:MAG: Ig-like domain-containing protein [Sarcina sp.]